MIVGIDLGTTNCALAYAEEEGPSIVDFAVPQLVQASVVETRAMALSK